MSECDRAFLLTGFGVQDMSACSIALREFGQREKSMEAFAQSAVKYFFDNLGAPNCANACALVRFFLTMPAERLPAGLRTLLPAGYSPSLRCLTLLGTAGIKAAWCERTQSVGHQVIPLADEDSVGRLPMISQLFQQFGLSVEELIRPTIDSVASCKSHVYDVFFVANAKDSSFVPSQRNFVIPYGVKSVIGFGGMLPSGDFFSMILFCKTNLERSTAEMFKSIALYMRLAILRFDQRAIFAESLN